MTFWQIILYFICQDYTEEESRGKDAGGRIERPKTSIGGHGFISLVYGTKDNMDRPAFHAMKARSEAFKLHQGIFYLLAPDGIGRSKLVAKVEPCPGVRVTARNWNTVRKFLEMTGK